MTISDFAPFYREAHGYDPFPWQRRLAEQVYQNREWPRQIGLPTSSGKTSLIDIAVFLLALEADRQPLARIARLRTFFVIDRRAVVDEAAEHAAKLAQKLEQASTGVLAEVANNLKRFRGSTPLRVAALRGGVYRDQTWADAPNQPLVCVSTVDQIGSRLLFRGYQLSECQRPVHAALTALDALLILDEAHLSAPFFETVGNLRKYGRTGTPIAPELALVRMTATPDDGSNAFGPTEADFSNPVLSRRWGAKKFAELRKTTSFEDEAVKAARELASGEGVNIVAIVVNRVSSALAIRNKLHHAETVLLTGRMRPYDRDRLYTEWKPYIEAREERQADKKVFVVATQTVEVGANLDFDALVTEAAPLDALRQRFGRLDRLGRLGETRAAILLRKGTLEGKDPVYGPALGETWEWLDRTSGQMNGRKVLDFGITSMRKLVDMDTAHRLATERKSAPLIFPAHIETWVQTNPTPEPDPDVAPFLHGPDALDAADVQVIWRADLKSTNEDEWVDILCAAPPLLREAVPVPIGAVRRWLAKSAPGVVADIEGVSENAEETSGILFKFLTWNGPDRIQDSVLYPGATIVVPAEYGGYEDCWSPKSSAVVTDIGNACSAEAFNAGRRRANIRVHPDALKTDEAGLAERLNEIRDIRQSEDDPQDAIQELLSWIGQHALDGTVRSTLPELKRAAIAFYPSGQGFVLTSSKPRKLPPMQRLLSRDDFGSDESEDDDTASLTVKITLTDHTRGVMEVGEHFTSALRVPQELAEDIALAIKLHDIGKADLRFQAMLHGGDYAKAAAEPVPLAKSPARMAAPAELRRARKRARYPEGCRHEFVSVGLIERHPVLEQAHDRDLVLHLIGTHHGYCRSFVPVWFDDEPPGMTVEMNGFSCSGRAAPYLHRLDSGWTERFWRLNEQYGYWGLAYLEAIVRRADCVQSRTEREDT